MIEENKATVEPEVLRDRIFVLTLVNILTDALGSAKDLYHKLEQKSSPDTDHNKTKEGEQNRVQDRRDSHSNIIESIGHHVRWSLDRRTRHDNDSEDDIVCNAALQVRSTYDRAYRKLGEAYAVGDDLAKIQLQSHIIKLQQVLVSIHQDLILSNYLTIASSHSQLIHLVQTIRITRGAAIQALDLLYQRLLAPHPPEKPSMELPTPVPPSVPPRPPRSRRSSSSSSSNTPIQVPPKPLPPAAKPSPKTNPNINKLFCRYALDLQYNAHLPLSHNFDVNGNRKCPYCRTHIAVRPKKAWEVVMRTSECDSKRKRFLVRNVFVVKCHRAGGGFACVLCARFGDADTVCRSNAALMEHLWKEHTAEDLEKDEDIVEC